MLRLVRLLLEDRLHEGAITVDATVGSGYDTAFLAERVGATGRVFGFDVQREAIERTRERLAEFDLLDRADLHETGHQRMLEVLPHAHVGNVRACTFNLGYLPGSDKQVITRPETTLPALDAALRSLAVGGLVTVVAYTGHPGGAEEAAAVVEWAERLDRERAEVGRYRPLNSAGPAPELVVIEKQ